MIKLANILFLVMVPCLTVLGNDPYAVGKMELSRGDYHRAIYHFSDIIAREPHHILAYLKRAKAYMLKDEAHLATRDIQRARELDMEFVRWYFQLSENERWGLKQEDVRLNPAALIQRRPFTITKTI